MSGKQAKRELRRQKEAARQAARRKQRQQTIFTCIVIGIIVAIGGVVIFLSAQEPTAEELAAAASEGASDGATEAVVPVTERPVACGGELPENAGEEKPTFSKPEQVTEKGVDYRAVIETSCGAVTVDLLEEQAPKTVNSFVFLAQKGFFDGLAIFRNATSIGALQTGSGTNEAAFDVGYTIPDELEAAQADGYQPGTVAMANAGPNTGGSQFFFVYNDNFKLPPQYAVFGDTDDKGVKVLQKIGNTPVVGAEAAPGDPAAEAPSEVAWIESVKVTTDK